MNTPLLRHASAISAISAALALTATLTLTGCTIETTAPAADSLASQPLAISGKVHGGQSPIYNAVVNLYAAGTSGYGSAPTKLATATTDVNGNFAFAPGSSAIGENTGLTSAWSCPTAASQIYITAIGGNTQGTGLITTNNTASALLAPLGPCSGISSSTQVIVNEITTVAGVFALAPYINPGTTIGGESIGTNSTTQATLGLNNAVSSIQNLASISQGSTITPPTYTGTNASVSTVTITATAESAKIITLANIIAACVNTPAATSTNCADLFSAAAPPPVPSATSFGSTQTSTFTFPTAQDTLQAAYYLATNPAALSSATFTTCNNGGTTRMSCLFTLASSTPPFQTSLTTQPSDWTIGVNYTASGFCNTGTAGTLSFFNGPTKAAVDASGNLWFVNGNATTDTLSGLSPVGKPISCVSFNTTGGVDGQGIAIDPSGNIWSSYNNAGGGNGLLELNATTIATSTKPINWETPFSVVDVASDGSGNIFLSGADHSDSNALGGTLYVLPSPGPAVYALSSHTVFSPTAAYPPTIAVSGLSAPGTSINLNFLSPDHNGNIWMLNNTNGTATPPLVGEYIYNAAPTNLTITGYSITSGTSVTFYTSAAPPSSWASGTQNVVVQGLSTGLATGTAVNHQGFTVSSISMAAPYSVTGTLIASPPTITGTTPNTAGAPASPTLTPTSGTVTDTGTLTGFTSGTTYSTFTTTAFNGLAIDSNGYLYTGTNCCSAADDFSFVKVTPNATVANSQYSVSSKYLGGNNGARAIALDGAANVWEGNILPATLTATTGNYAIAEITTAGSGTSATFTALAPSGAAPTVVLPGEAGTCISNSVSASDTATCPTGGGFIKSTFLAAYDMAIDPSGNVWVLNTGTDNYTTSSTFVFSGASITEVIGAAVPVVTPIAIAAGNGTQATKP